MTTPRFFVPAPSGPAGAAASAGNTVDLPEAASHHARRVLRLRPGDPIVLFDGAGNEYRATLLPAAGTNDTLGRALILGVDAVDRETRMPLTLVQALSAQEKIDWLIEKCAELGVRRLVLAPAERSVVRLDAERQERRLGRWRDIGVAACAQCGRNRLLDITLAADFAAALHDARQAGARHWVLEPAAALPLAAGLGAADLAAGAVCVVGPEGGFTDAEIATAVALGYTPARLGPRVLRTETAGLVAAAALLALAGEFGADGSSAA
jgi:16S rRNA (uracil1498-N3)-methyltransferase